MRFTVTGGYVGWGIAAGTAIVMVARTSGGKAPVTSVVGTAVDVGSGSALVGVGLGDALVGGGEVTDRGDVSRRGAAWAGSAGPINPTRTIAAITARTKAPTRRLRCC